MKLTQDRGQVLGEILRYVPVGTNIGRAQRVMERNGFSCVLMEDQPFRERRHMTYLYCDRRTTEVSFTFTRWQVALFRERGRVADVDVGVSLTGL